MPTVRSNPVIVVPGIIATYLRDRYPIPPETIWSVLTKDYEKAALHPDDVRAKLNRGRRVFEASEPAQVVADQVYEIAYKELIEELRFNLRSTEDEPVPVYSFGYDWRQPLEIVQDELAAFIEEVKNRTALLRHYRKAGYDEDPKVNLVGHSMGGLVIAGCIAQHGKSLGIDKVVTLASPFQGSFEMVIKVTTGTANLGVPTPSSREREAARLTPSLYYLVPSFAGGLTVAPGLPASLFDPDLWQPSIIDTIAQYISKHGVDPTVRTKSQQQAAAQEVFGGMLSMAAAHRRTLDQLDLGAAGLTSEDWLCVVGVNSVTRVHLAVDKAGKSPQFAFSSTDRQNRWIDESVDARRETGDGTVPFRGAAPKFLPSESLVCVRPNDFGYWEIGDKLTLEIGGFHGLMPNMNMLHRLIVRFLTGSADPRKNTWGLPPPGVSSAEWKPPLPLNMPNN